MNTHHNHTPAAQESAFDFLHGRWQVQHRQLAQRLAGCSTWLEFGGSMLAMPTLGGHGNMDDNFLDHPAGAYRAVTLRSCDPVAQTWAIWWLDGRHPHVLDVPVTGAFMADGVGRFYADDIFGGQPIRVRFEWHGSDSDTPRWEQAFSADGGNSWETNWTMNFTKEDTA